MHLFFERFRFSFFKFYWNFLNCFYDDNPERKESFALVVLHRKRGIVS